MPTDSPSELQLQQLAALRNSLHQSTLDHFRRELSKTLPTDQVIRIVDHKNVDLELNRLIQRVSLESHPNLDSLSFKIAQGLTQVAEPHVRLAVSLSNPNLKPEDILQDVIKNNADVRSAYEPLSDSLKPAAPNSSVSKLYQQLASPLVVNPHHLPTLKPEIDKVVSLGSSESDPAKQQQISEHLHQDLLSEVLTHQQPALTNSRQIIKTYLQTHGLNTNQIDNQSFNQFVDYFNKYQEVVSSDQGIAALQLIAEAEKISPKDLQSILSQSNQTPESLIQEISTNPVSTPSTPSTAPSPPISSSPPSPDQISAAIDAADHHSYTSTSSASSQPFNVRQIIQFIRRYFSQQSSSQPNVFQTIINFFRGSPVEGSSAGSSSFGSPLGSSVGDFAKQGLSQTGQALGSAVKQGVKAAAKAAVQAAKAVVRAAGKAAAQFVAKALFLNPYFWIAVVVIILVVAVLYMVAGASPQKVALMQTDAIGGNSEGVDFGSYPNIVCSQTPVPLTIPKPSQSIASRAWEIVNNLEQGIWCYWNKSPDYPNLFDSSLDPQVDANYCYTNGCNIFWCTWLVIKAYTETNTPIQADALNSAVMENYFMTNNRYISFSNATPTNIKPGHVVFFKTFSGPNRTNHVAIVSSVDQDSITFVQSNAGTKIDTITFNSSGVGTQDLPWAAITGFGTP